MANREEQETYLRDLIKQYEIDVAPWREVKTKEWRRAELFWEGESRLWWSDVAQDYRYPGVATLSEIENFDLDAQEDRTINVYEAHGRSIIAALSSTVPGIRFYPQDAKNSKDLLTAEIHTKLSEIISRENDFPLLFAKALYILFNQDYVASHIYSEEKFEHGSYFEEEMDEEGELANYVEQPKSRTFIDVYGAMHVVIPPFVRKQSGIPYLILKSLHHRAETMEIYGRTEELRQAIESSNPRSDEDYDRSFRDVFTTGEDQVMVRQCWIRPWGLTGEEMGLRRKYPMGIKATFIDDSLVEVVEEDLDAHWRITSDPLSEYLIGRPLGKNLISIQDTTNDLNELTLQTIAHGIPNTYADPNVVNFEAMGEQPNEPGVTYPALPAMGKRLADSFYTTDRSTLSKEVASYTEYINYAGQFVSGDFPSVHGDSLEGGSRTASEYTQSRQNALQRLSIIYKSLSGWVKDTYEAAVKNRIENMKEDELIVDYKDGAFLNLWIKLQDLTGNIGRTEPVGSDVFPNTPALIRELYFNLLELKNPLIDAMLQDPNNMGLVSKALGLDDLYVPGEDDRAKQWAEIAKLIEEVPMQAGVDFVPSVQVLADVDNHINEAQVCLLFLKSSNGRILKEQNPNGYLNVLLHYLQHKQFAELAMMAEAPTEGENGGGDGSGAGGSGRPPES